MRLTVVILAHNKVELTRRCLQSLAPALSGTDHEVRCVDNGSAEDLASLRDEAFRFRRLEIQRNEENLTFSVANNRAAVDARGDWLLFLNNDVVVAPGSIRALAESVGRHPDAGVCGARLIYPDGRLQHAGMEQMLWGVVSNYGVGAAGTDPRFMSAVERFAVTGAMLAIRREIFATVGGFDEAYAWGYEDVDLCLRAWQAGSGVWYLPEVVGIHAESATLRSNRRRADADSNYAEYRRRWDPVLLPAERAYLEWLTDSGISRVIIFGTGAAGEALRQTLAGAGIQVVGFAATSPQSDDLCGLPVYTLADLHALAFDRVIAGTQYFFEVESQLEAADPEHAPLFPVLPRPFHRQGRSGN